MRTLIFVTTTFEGLHRWPHAPKQVSFLASPHRHTFHVKAWLRVDHDDRDLEFFMVKAKLDGWLYAYPYDLGTRSCETIARDLRERLVAEYGDDRDPIVEVSEDGQNGALVSA